MEGCFWRRAGELSERLTRNVDALNGTDIF